MRGHPGDFDRWAQSGLTGWSWADVLPVFRAQEDWQGPPDPLRGKGGAVTVGFNDYADPITSAFLEAGDQAGHGLTDDYNGATQEGFGRWQSSIRGGRRCSAVGAWIAPARRRETLTLWLNTHVTRIEIASGRATGVICHRGADLVRVRAVREVLLCGGVINSPQLLMLSGIGDAAALAPLDIGITADLPGVGRNLRDHISAAVSYQRSAPGPLHAAMRADRILPALGNALLRGKGIATALPAAGMAFLRSEEAGALPDVQLFCIAAPMSAGPWAPGLRAPYQDGYAIRVALLRPESTGTVSLTSADPFTAPRIVQNFLATDQDRRVLRAGLRLARHTGAQAALRGFAGRELFPGSDRAEDLDLHIRRTGVSVHHPLGTCRMGVAGDPGAVVDAQLRVFGIEGLRVVDASVMPDMIGGNINAAVMMLAGRAADMILADQAAA